MKETIQRIRSFCYGSISFSLPGELRKEASVGEHPTIFDSFISRLNIYGVFKHVQNLEARENQSLAGWVRRGLWRSGALDRRIGK